MQAPFTVNVRMTNTQSGDFIGTTVTPDGKIVESLTGNTATGQTRFAFGSDHNNNITYANCYGNFNSSANTYIGDCTPEFMNLEDFKKTGSYFRLTLKRQ